MRIAREFDFRDLQDNCWDCDDVLEAVYNADKEDALMDLLEDVFNSDVPTLTEVNDLLRFDGEWVLESLGIDPEEDEDEDLDHLSRFDDEDDDDDDDNDDELDHLSRFD